MQITWWRHQMETFSASLALCAWNSPATGEFPAQRPMTRSIDVFFDGRLNERLSKQSWGWWSEMPSRSLLRHCNENAIYDVSIYMFCYSLLYTLFSEVVMGAPAQCPVCFLWYLNPGIGVLPTGNTEQPSSGIYRRRTSDEEQQIAKVQWTIMIR